MALTDKLKKLVGSKTILVFGLMQVVMWLCAVLFLMKFGDAVILGPSFMMRRIYHQGILTPLAIGGALGILTGVKRHVKHCRLYWLSLAVSIVCMWPTFMIITRLSCDCTNFEQCEALHNFAEFQDARFVNRYHMPAWLDSAGGKGSSYKKKRRVHVKKPPGGVALAHSSLQQAVADEASLGSLLSSSDSEKLILNSFNRSLGGTPADQQKSASTSRKKRGFSLLGLWSSEPEASGDDVPRQIKGFMSPSNAHGSRPSDASSDSDPKIVKKKSVSVSSPRPGALMEKKATGRNPLDENPLKAAVNSGNAPDPESTGRSLRDTFKLSDDTTTAYTTSGGKMVCRDHFKEDRRNLLGAMRECRELEGTCSGSLKDGALPFASSDQAPTPCADRKTLWACEKKSKEGNAECKWDTNGEASKLAKDICPEPLYEQLLSCALDVKGPCGGLEVRVYPSDGKGGWIQEWGDHGVEDFRNTVSWKVTICTMAKDPPPKEVPGAVIDDPAKSLILWFVKDTDADEMTGGEEARKALAKRQLSIGPIEEYWENIALEHKQRCHCNYPGDSCQVDPINKGDESGVVRSWCELDPSEDHRRECMDHGVKPIASSNGLIWARELCEEAPATSASAPGCNCVTDIPVRLTSSEMKKVNPQFISAGNDTTVIGNSCQKWYTGDDHAWCVTGFDSACADREELSIGYGHTKVYKSAIPCDVEYDDVVGNAEDLCFPIRNALLVIFTIVAALHPPMLLIVYVFLANHCGDQGVVDNAYDVIADDDFDDDGDFGDDDEDDDDEDDDDEGSASGSGEGSGSDRKKSKKKSKSGKSKRRSTDSGSSGG